LAALVCLVALALALPSTAQAVDPLAFHGVVTDVDAEPIAGASVDSGYADGPAYIEVWDETDATGAYELHLPAGEHWIGVSATHFEPQYVEGVSFDGVNAVEQNFELLWLPEAFNGTVTEAVSGLRLGGIQVDATFGVGQAMYYAWGVTEEDGTYKIYAPPQGAYDLAAYSTEGDYSMATQLGVDFDDPAIPVTKDFELQAVPKAFTGTVTDALTEAPLSGAYVDASYYLDEQAVYSDWDTTDEFGSYDLYVPAQTYELFASAFDYEAAFESGLAFDGGQIPVTKNFVLTPIDRTAPRTTSDVKTTYVGTATIALTATDSNSGVAATYYKLDGAPQVAGKTVTTSAVGSHTLVFWSKDKAGNIEAENTVNFTVTAPVAPLPADTVAPVTTSDVQSTYLASAVIQFAATDAGSGVAATYFQLDGAAQSPGSIVVVSSCGPHMLSFWSVDKAGNTEVAKSVTFTVTKPDASITAPKAAKTMKKGKGYTVTGTLKSGRNGTTKAVRIHKYRKVGGKWKKEGYVKATFKGSKGFTAKIKLSKKGEWKLKAYVPEDARYAATWGKELKVKVK